MPLLLCHSVPFFVVIRLFVSRPSLCLLFSFDVYPLCLCAFVALPLVISALSVVYFLKSHRRWKAEVN